QRCTSTTRALGGFSLPRKAFLNGTMPELVNIRVGSLAGTSELEDTTRCPFERKNSRKSERISALVFINRIDPGIAGTPTDVRESEFSVELVTGIADIGAGNGAYCGGIEATAQEKGCAAAAFVDV